jgi:PEP-CTERM/exosortase A-associated glycosyltransferase
VTEKLSLASFDHQQDAENGSLTELRSFSALPASDLPIRKVLHVLDHSLPLYSGYTFRTQSILVEQRRNNWAPVGLTSSKHEASWKKPSPQTEEIDGFRFYRTGTVRQETELRLMKRLAHRIEEVSRIENPDLLHAHSPVLNVLPAIWMGRKLGIPVVYEIRAFWEDAAVDHKTYSENSWKYKAVRSMETWACRHVSQVAVLCEGLRQDLVQRGIPMEKLTVVFNGIDPEEFCPCPPDVEFANNLGIAGKKILGFIGSFYRYEGLDLLVKAFAKLCATRDDLALLLVGGGEVEAELCEQIEQLRLPGKAILAGRIPHDKIAGVYSLMDVLVYPRYSMRLTDLVTPIKPLEAMAMSKPIVASDVGGHRELIRHGFTGLLFAPGDASSLAATLERLLDNPRLAGQLAAQGNHWVRQNHTWKKTTSVYSSIYCRAVENGRRRDLRDSRVQSTAKGNGG